MIPAIILAAGASRRLGEPKQLLRHQGQTLLRRAVAAAGACAPVLVVTGCRAEAMAAELAGLEVQVVVNPGWEEGMASSIRAGVAALPEGWEAVLFLVCDQPAVDAALVGRLISAWSGAPVACAYDGVLGIPALLPARFRDRLLGLAGDRGARSLLGEPGVVAVPFPEGAWDVDVPGDSGMLEPGDGLDPRTEGP